MRRFREYPRFHQDLALGLGCSQCGYTFALDAAPAWEADCGSPACSKKCGRRLDLSYAEFKAEERAANLSTTAPYPSWVTGEDA